MSDHHYRLVCDSSTAIYADAIMGLSRSYIGPSHHLRWTTGIRYIFMLGKSFKVTPLGAPRGNLRVLSIAKNYRLEFAMSVNKQPRDGIFVNARG